MRAVVSCPPRFGVSARPDLAARPPAAAIAATTVAATRRTGALRASTATPSGGVTDYSKCGKRRLAAAPAVGEQIANLLDAGLPDAQHVLVGALVQTAERPVAEQLPHLGRVGSAQAGDVRHRLALVRRRHARQARPREVLEPRGVARVGVDRLDDLPD